MQKNIQLFLFAFSLVIYEGTTYAANDMIMPGMLMVIREFHYPISYVALSLTFYLLGNAILQLFLGPIAERYGKRRVIITGNIIFLGFTIFLALSMNMRMFLLGRLLQGSGLAFIAMGYALIHENFNDKDAVKITSLMANISILAPIIGPVIGGYIISYISWRYVFVCSLITGAISLYGLMKYAPKNKTPLQKLKLHEVISGYYNILKIPTFSVGAVAVGLMVIPSMLWIAISPTLIMHTLKLSVGYYMYYQAIAIGGFMISTIINQVIAGRVDMMQLIKIGLKVSLVGFAIMAVFFSNILFVAIGLCISCIGLGLQLGTMYRVLGRLEVKSQSMLFSLMAFVQIIIMTVLLELCNNILYYFDYSLLSFVTCSILLGISSLRLTLKFVAMNKTRNWQ